MRDQVPARNASRYSPLRGTEAERQAATDVDPYELNATLDQLRIFVGTTHVPPSAYHTAADQSARLGLHGTAARGCWPGDFCTEIATDKTYQCISNNGGSAGDWILIKVPVDSALSNSSFNPVENQAVKNALDGKSNVGHTHSYSEITGKPSTFPPSSHTHPLSDVTDAGSAAALNVPSSGDAASGEVVKGSDTRLSDSRPPTAHPHLLSDVTDAGTAAALNVPATGDAASGEVVKGDDTRLSDSRTPTAHTHPLSDVTDAGTAAALNVPATGDAASGEVVKGDDTRLTNSRTPTAHTHTLSDVTDAGSAAALNVPSSGDAASGEVVKGSDTRLSDARNPLSHTHSWGDITSKPSLQSELPVGTIIMWVSSVGGVSAPSFDSSEWIRCEGGTISGGIWNTKTAPDYRDKFLRGSSTSGTEGGSNTHTHTVSVAVANVEADAGNCVPLDEIASTTTGSASNIPEYRSVILLLKYA